MGSIVENYALFVSQFSGQCGGGELDFPFEEDCHQKDFFKHLVWGEGNYQQFKYSWFVKPSSGFKVSKGMYLFFETCFSHYFLQMKLLSSGQNLRNQFRSLSLSGKVNQRRKQQVWILKSLWNMFTESQKLQKHQAHLVAALLLVHLFWWKSKRKERVSFLCFQNIENLYIYIFCR